MMKSIRLSKSVPPHSVKFVFFDGEECFLEYSKTDGLYGSRRLSEKWAASGLLEKCDAMILLDMVGDADLKIRFPTGSDKTLVDLAFQAADKFGVREYFSMADGDMLDDHRPFQDKGVPSIDFIDFDYGPSNRYWHTSADTKDKLAGESFTIVGRVALQVLWNVPFR
jgi:glutaminyl-peptide cyclotransferase